MNLNLSKNTKNSLFTHFEQSIVGIDLPEKFTFPFRYIPHPLSQMAAEQLQTALENNKELNHNFGLTPNAELPIIGKMFGVLVVKNKEDQIGFLSAFSGKMAGANTIGGFVPPIYDGLEEGDFLTPGMIELSRINQLIKSLEASDAHLYLNEIIALKKQRSENSFRLQDKLFEQYTFLNQLKEEKSLIDIFYDYLKIRPSSGAGDCALPKLLQYAFKNDMQPLAMAEFWWGLSPKSNHWKHKSYYPACKEKCEPILQHMLKGINLDNVL